MRVTAVLLALLALAGVPAAAAEGSSASEEPQVIAMSFSGRHRAYPISLFVRGRVLNDVLGHQEIAIFHDPERDVSSAWFRTIFGEPIEFSGNVNGTVADDLTTVTRWDLSTGEAVAGNLMGQRLIAVPIRKTSWRSLKAQFPSAQLFDPDAR